MAVAKYPWDEWDDDDVHGLKHTGPDAEADVQRFRNTLYMRSKRNNKNVRTRVDAADDGLLIRFQMLPKDGDKEFSEIFRDGMDEFEKVELTPEGNLAV